MEDLGGKTFKIPEANYTKLEKAIEKLNSKAIKLCGEMIQLIPYSYEMVDAGHGHMMKVYEVLIDCIAPKLNGWSFIARIDHSNKELGNIVRPVPGVMLDDRFRTSASVCEHCNVKRFRRDTYVVREDATGDTKQVGSTCLKDFLGHENAEKVAKMAELIGYAVECARGYTNTTGEDHRYINLEIYLSYVAQDIRARGYYYSRTAARQQGGQSSADSALYHMEVGGYEDPKEDDRKLAEVAIAWVQDLGEGGRQLTDYEHNIHVIAASGCCEYRSLGFAASIVGAFLRNQPKQARRESQHLGHVGERIDVQVTMKSVRVVESMFGSSFLNTFVTQEGDVLKTFTNKSLADEGKTVSLRGTVKQHDEYKGQKQTMLSRVVVKT